MIKINVPQLAVGLRTHWTGPVVALWSNSVHPRRLAIGQTRVLFSFQKFCKFFSDFLSHRILSHIYETLNIDKKITNWIVYL